MIATECPKCGVIYTSPLTLRSHLCELRKCQRCGQTTQWFQNGEIEFCGICGNYKEMT